jgi:hypothetical protein
MLDPLLVQLFGREVTDRLAQAGFDSTDSIARVNAELLAEESGIAPSLARRIIAVAIESDRPPPNAGLNEAAPRPGPNEAARSAGPDESASNDEPHADRRVRRPFRRPQSPLASPSPSGDPGGGGVEVGRDEPALPPRGAPYVDDAGLIFSIGNAIRSGRPPGMTIAVAEEILDPPPAPSKEAPVALPPGGESQAKITSTQKAPVTKPALLDGSFWSFGRWSPRRPPSKNQSDSSRSAAGKKAGERKGGPAPPTAPVPRRRSGDGR